jgi:hypothetical protein
MAIEELARKLSIAPGKLRDTIEEFNRALMMELTRN